MGSESAFIDWRLGSRAQFDNVTPWALPPQSNGLLCRPNQPPAPDWARTIASTNSRRVLDPGTSHLARFQRLSNTDKLGIALKSAVSALGPEIQHKAQELLAPANLAIMAGALAIWIGAQATPVGWVVDIGMVGLGVVALGAEALSVMRELHAFGMGVIEAQSEVDLIKAGRHLSKAVAIIGVDVVMAILLKKAVIKVKEVKARAGAEPGKPLLFGKYDQAQAARTLPAEKPRPPATPLPKVSADKAAEAAALRARVKANIAQSQAARQASNFEQLARYETAYNFYTRNGFSADRAMGHLAGIDYTKPVAIVEIPQGTQLAQHVAGGRVGNYFAPSGTPAEMLGINPAGRTPLLFEAAESTSALKSTAAPIVDNWTVPGEAFSASGGGTQFFVPAKQAMTLVSP